jgi:maltooligosyltrehalose trehalohydrolase
MNIRFTGAILGKNGNCRFSVWAPEKETITLHLVESSQLFPMIKDVEGYFSIDITGIAAGTRYFFRTPDGEDFPDPASFFQPDGVHGPSSVVDHQAFRWTDAGWSGVPTSQLILYELHVGTFTKAGTFEAVIEHLDHLRELGVSAIQLMPVGQFPGKRNWGYDGVYPYAVQSSYGGPEGLKKLVDACHAKGIGVFLDVVYNHLGPEGNYFFYFGPYFTKQYRTPWGDAINFDGEWSDGVREYFANNALYWFKNFHLDGLRLDAVHMAFDNGAVHFWQYLNNRVRLLEEEVGRRLHMIAESDSNSPRVIEDVSRNGLGFTSQWLDDFHHALYVLLDKNGKERYVDFGLMSQFAKAYKEGFVHSGEYVKFRKRRHGTSSAGIDGNKFIVFNLNHDQVGNRPNGERLCVLVDHNRLKVAAAAILLSPYIPMLFMGEEYADRSPFYYFVSHSDQQLIEAVRNGRREEFKNFGGSFEPPDAQSEETFENSKLDWGKRVIGEHAMIFEWHKALITLRRQLSPFQSSRKNDISVNIESDAGLLILRKDPNETENVFIIMNFSERPLRAVVPAIRNSWKKILDSNDSKFSSDRSRSLSPEEVRGGGCVEMPSVSVVVYRADRNA